MKKVIMQLRTAPVPINDLCGLYIILQEQRLRPNTSYTILFHNTFSKIVIKVVDYFSTSYKQLVVLNS